jgi:hypothetical protein
MAHQIQVSEGVRFRGNDASSRIVSSACDRQIAPQPLRCKGDRRGDGLFIAASWMVSLALWMT